MVADQDGIKYIGGHAAFAEWAREHPTDFYKIAARLIPIETATKEDTTITVEIVRFSSLEEASLTTPVIEQNCYQLKDW